jgi:uncharacterized protein YndB with AHSA1/START domain
MATDGIKRSKIELEYSLRSSPHILFQYISNPSGLQSWFADHVDIFGGVRYRFAWNDGTEYQAKIIKNVPNKYIKFAIEGSADTLLESVMMDLEHLLSDYKELIVVATDEGLEEISNYAQDQALDLEKSIWMLRSTLE